MTRCHRRGPELQTFPTFGIWDEVTVVATVTHTVSRWSPDTPQTQPTRVQHMQSALLTRVTDRYGRCSSDGSGATSYGFTANRIAQAPVQPQEPAVHFAYSVAGCFSRLKLYPQLYLQRLFVSFLSLGHLAAAATYRMATTTQRTRSYGGTPKGAMHH